MSTPARTLYQTRFYGETTMRSIRRRIYQVNGQRYVFMWNEQAESNVIATHSSGIPFYEDYTLILGSPHGYLFFDVYVKPNSQQGVLPVLSICSAVTGDVLFSVIGYTATTDYGTGRRTMSFGGLSQFPIDGRNFVSNQSNVILGREVQHIMSSASDDMKMVVRLDTYYDDLSSNLYMEQGYDSNLVNSVVNLTIPEGRVFSGAEVVADLFYFGDDGAIYPSDEIVNYIFKDSAAVTLTPTPGMPAYLYLRAVNSEVPALQFGYYGSGFGVLAYTVLANNGELELIPLSPSCFSSVGPEGAVSKADDVLGITTQQSLFAEVSFLPSGTFMGVLPAGTYAADKVYALTVAGDNVVSHASAGFVSGSADSFVKTSVVDSFSALFFEMPLEEAAFCRDPIVFGAYMGASSVVDQYNASYITGDLDTTAARFPLLHYRKKQSVIYKDLNLYGYDTSEGKLEYSETYATALCLPPSWFGQNIVNGSYLGPKVRDIAYSKGIGGRLDSMLGQLSSANRLMVVVSDMSYKGLSAVFEVGIILGEGYTNEPNRKTVERTILSEYPFGVFTVPEMTLPYDFTVTAVPVYGDFGSSMAAFRNRIPAVLRRDGREGYAGIEKPGSYCRAYDVSVPFSLGVSSQYIKNTPALDYGNVSGIDVMATSSDLGYLVEFFLVDATSGEILSTLRDKPSVSKYRDSFDTYDSRFADISAFGSGGSSIPGCQSSLCGQTGLAVYDSTRQVCLSSKDSNFFFIQTYFYQGGADVWVNLHPVSQNFTEVFYNVTRVSGGNSCRIDLTNNNGKWAAHIYGGTASSVINFFGS